MALMVTYNDGQGTGETMVRLTRKMWYTEDKERVVEDGDVEAAILLGTEGDEISRAEAERLGMLGDTGEPSGDGTNYERQVDAHSGMAAPGVDPAQVVGAGGEAGDAPSSFGEEVAGHDVTKGDEVVPELVAEEEARAQAIESAGQSVPGEAESASAPVEVAAEAEAPSADAEAAEGAEAGESDEEAKQAEASPNKKARRGGSK